MRAGDLADHEQAQAHPADRMGRRACSRQSGFAVLRVARDRRRRGLGQERRLKTMERPRCLRGRAWGSGLAGEVGSSWDAGDL
jgi:hypothetical protein